VIVYLDASAMVKLYVEEPGSREVAELVVLATYDRELWRAARRWGLDVWPEATDFTGFRR